MPPTGFWTQYKNLTLRSFKLSAVRILDKVKLIENILICLIVSVIWFQLRKLEWIFPIKKRDNKSIIIVWFGFMVFNATFNTFSVISWR
jgi:hypothetical protein